MKIIIGADFVVTSNEMKKFQTSNSSPISEELKKIWQNHDYRIFNVEGPLTDSKRKNKKNGPNLKMPIEAIELIKSLDPSLVTLANNHIFDYMEEGVNDTVSMLEKFNIPFIGLKGRKGFSKFHVFEKNNLKVGVYTICENEFLTNNSGDFGAIGFDYTTTSQTIMKIKKEVDQLVLLYHGGKEYYQYSTPEMKKRMHMFVDFGADFIVAQHSHCIGTEEIYNGKTILYGQGNFVFPASNKKDNELWNKGFLVSLTIKQNVIIVNYIPVIQTDKGTLLMNNNEKELEMSKFKERNLDEREEIKTKKIFNEHVEKEIISRMYSLFGYTKFKSRLDQHIFKSFFLKRRIKKADLDFILNMFRCEAHSECTINVLEQISRHNNS